MNEHFLYALRQDPSPALRRRVYRTIASLPGDEATPAARRGPGASPAHRPRRRALALATLAVFLLLLASALFSPGVRALVEDVVRRIGGFTVRETELYPVADGVLVGADDNQYLTLEAARVAVDFEIHLPAALPDRYQMVDEVVVGPGGDRVDVRWKGTETRGDGLWLRIWPADGGVEWLIGTGSAEAIDLNGQEALFIRGGWLQNTQSWDPDIARAVRWVRAGLAYDLSTGGEFSCPDEPDHRCPLGDDDLIAFAASVP